MSKESRVPLFLISFAVLFFEVLVIRWIATEIVVFGYFKNLVLMGAFVGLGLGCATFDRKAMASTGTEVTGLSKWFPLLFLIITCIIVAAPYINLTHINFIIQTDVHFWLRESDIVNSVEKLMGNAGWVIAIFLIIVSIFDSLGQLLGRELAKHESLRAYTANLGGSAAGCLVYSLLAFLQTPPAVWLLVGFGSVVPFYKKPWQLATMLVCIGLTFWSGLGSVWSPYYRVDVYPYRSKDDTFTLGSNIIVNHVNSFQRTVDFSDAFLKQHPELKDSPEYKTYNIPYDARPNAENVLILGAGSGNDIAGALRHGAKRVDAVEIDPGILELGKTVHPEHPYADERVHKYLNDARNFISATPNKYDLIIFGFVDSSVSFSMLSSVRLDNFLYTVESLKLATQALNPKDGVACLSFAAGAPWMRDRLYQMVEQAAGEAPVALKNSMSNNNSIIVMWGPGLRGERREQFINEYKPYVIPAAELSTPVRACTDDWPFIYQKEPVLSSAYGIMLSLLLLIAGSLTVVRFRLQPKSFTRYAQFFFLGAGFLLLETRAMLAVAVLFGSTWLVNSIVIFLILLMALCANTVVERFRNINIYLAYGGLIISLVALYLVPLSTVAGADLLTRVGAASILIGLPFAFAGLVFSTAYSKVTEPDKALGINILGALLGGCLEYVSVIIGTKDLVLLAIALYVISLIAMAMIKEKPQGSVAETAPA